MLNVLRVGIGLLLSCSLAAPVATRASVAAAALRAGAGILPENALTHFCIITAYDSIDATMALYGTLFGVTPPPSGIAGGPTSNGTYVVDGKPTKLVGTTKIAFLQLNNLTKMEFLAGDPATPSWWRDVYVKKGLEVHHQGYEIGVSPIWPVVEAFSAAGLGDAVQWGRWGAEDHGGGACGDRIRCTRSPARVAPLTPNPVDPREQAATCTWTRSSRSASLLWRSSRATRAATRCPRSLKKVIETGRPPSRFPSFTISCISKGVGGLQRRRDVTILLYERTFRCLLGPFRCSALAAVRHIARQLLRHPDSALSNRSSSPAG
jgi:hypothetical protein